jgi:hypothetical protein
MLIIRSIFMVEARHKLIEHYSSELNPALGWPQPTPYIWN